jgi:L-threonylcarbamoyladenylate synthase
MTAVVGDIDVINESTERPQSPGQLRSHYAPCTKMEPLRDDMRPPLGERVGLLAISPIAANGYAVVEVLSPTGDLQEAAANLFSALRRLDVLQLDRIVCEFAPSRGIGLAINDRLLRGCQR